MKNKQSFRFFSVLVIIKSFLFSRVQSRREQVREMFLITDIACGNVFVGAREALYQ